MKRLLQGLGLLQLFLVVALTVRVVNVWTTTLPEAGEIPDLPALSALPPPRPVPKISESVTDAVVEHDLFDEERGQGEEIDISNITVEAPPVAPPTAVKLMGVMFVGDEPVGILLDSTVKPEQQSVRKGEMFGEYEVGDITKSGLLLLGGAEQQFQIPLHVAAAGGGGAAPPPAGTAAAPVAGTRPATARPVPPRNDAAGGGADQKPMSASERAQAIALRNHEMRKNTPRNAATAAAAAAEGKGEGQDGAVDPAQVRLKALERLRQAAKNQ